MRQRLWRQRMRILIAATVGALGAGMLSSDSPGRAQASSPSSEFATDPFEDLSQARAESGGLSVDPTSRDTRQVVRLEQAKLSVVSSKSSIGVCLDVFVLVGPQEHLAGAVGGCGVPTTESLAESWSVGGVLVGAKSYVMVFGFAEPDARSVVATTRSGEVIEAPVVEGTWLLVTTVNGSADESSAPFQRVESRDGAGRTVGVVNLAEELSKAQPGPLEVERAGG